MSRIYVLFHASSVRANGLHVWCMDGLFAACAARLAMPDAVLVPAMYGKPPALDLKTGDTVYLLDLTYPAPVIEGWADSGAKVEVIDHHKTAMDDLSGLSDRVLTEFDMNRSGAVMAWQSLMGFSPTPELFRYVQDRDLWRKELPGCDLVALGLRQLTKNVPLEKALDAIEALLASSDPVGSATLLGKAEQRLVDLEIQAALERCTKRLILGREVIYFAAFTERQREAYSDIAHALLKAHPKCEFACVQSGEGWALRSNESHADVSEVARMCGGGGHRNASGCGADMPLWATQFIQALRGLLKNA